MCLDSVQIKKKNWYELIKAHYEVSQVFKGTWLNFSDIHLGEYGSPGRKRKQEFTKLLYSVEQIPNNLLQFSMNAIL